MYFEDPLFLLALGAVALPILLHLLYRFRKRVVIFGSLRFLSEALRRNRRRLRLRDILLLALRCAAVAMLALGFSRPRLERWGRPPQTRRDVVFILDDSFSMSAAPGARTLFEEAKSRTISALKRLGPSDRAAVVLTSRGGRVLSQLSSDPGAVARSVRSARQSFERAELTQAIRTALGILAGSDAPSKKILLATDLQANSWDRTALSKLDVGGVEFELLLSPEQIPNLTVSDVQLFSKAWSVEAPVRVRARISNFGPTDVKAVQVRLIVGKEGTPRTSVAVDVPANGESWVELAYLATAPGEFPAAVEISGQDALPADDKRYLIINLRDRARILCIQDEVQTGRNKYLDPSYFVRVALSPSNADSDEVFSSEAAESRVVSAADLRAADAFFIFGGDDLPESALEAMPALAREGRGILLAPPHTSGREGWELPSRLERLGIAAARAVRGLSTGPIRPEGMGLARWKLSHPIWAPFVREGHSQPFKVLAKNIYELEPLKGSDVVATFEDGRPAVVAREEGRLRVLQLAFSLRPESSDLPKRKAFVPFIHGAAVWLGRIAEDELPKAFEVGRPLVYPEGKPSSSSVELIEPDGSLTRFSEAAQAAPERPGIYIMKVPTERDVHILPIAVNLPVAESDLRPGNREDFLAALRRGVSERLPSAQAVDGDDKREENRFWAVLIALAGGIMVIESLLANRVLLAVRAARSEA